MYKQHLAIVTTRLSVPGITVDRAVMSKKVSSEVLYTYWSLEANTSPFKRNRDPERTFSKCAVTFTIVQLIFTGKIQSFQ